MYQIEYKVKCYTKSKSMYAFLDTYVPVDMLFLDGFILAIYKKYTQNFKNKSKVTFTTGKDLNS